MVTFNFPSRIICHVVPFSGFHQVALAGIVLLGVVVFVGGADSDGEEDDDLFLVRPTPRPIARAMMMITRTAVRMCHIVKRRLCWAGFAGT